MTDKQMEGYKRDYFMRFDHEPVNIEYIWDWIEDLVEEVEREGYEQGYQNSETEHDWAKGKDVKNVWFKPNN